MPDSKSRGFSHVKAACEARHDPEAWDVAALTLLSHREEREKLVKQGGASHPGRQHGYLTETEIGNYAYRLLSRCHLDNVAPPKGLMLLIQALLEQDRQPRHLGVPREGRKLTLAREYLEKNPSATARQVADASGLNHSTIVRHQQSGTLPRRAR